MSTASGTTDKIRSAEETVARAKEALEAAESGLHAAEQVSVKADSLRSHPVMVWSIVLISLGLLAWLVMRDSES